MNNRFYSILFIGTFFILASCSKEFSKLTTQTETVVYPSPPDTARIQFLTKITHSIDATGTRSAFARFIAGEDTKLPIKKPYGIDIHNGKVYICDLDIGGLEIIDLEEKTFNYFVPKGRGQLKLPLNCFVDENDYLYVADGKRLQVVIFDSEGNYIDCFGGKENYKPSDVYVYDNKIWVPNLKNNRVNVYEKDTYKLLYAFPETETGTEGYLYSPTNIYVTQDMVYVSDFGDFKIKMYTHDGKYINSIGSYGKNIGQFVRPKGIAVDRESNLFVVDAGFENTQIFNKEGKLLMYFGGPYQGPGGMWLPAKITIDYDNLKYYQKYVDPDFNLKYLIFVTNQFGPDKVSVYGSIEQKEHVQF